MSINKANVLELAEFIAKHKELKFDMSKSNNPACGSAGCIGGFAAALWPELEKEKVLLEYGFNRYALGGKLGLMQSGVDALCFPADEGYEWEDEGQPIEYREVSRAGAIATLRRLAETGVVEWRLGEQTAAAAPADKGEQI